MTPSVQCSYPGCTDAPTPAPFTRAGQGMCRPHNLTILVQAAETPRPVHPRERNIPADPYIRWSQAVMDARAVEFNHHVVSNLTTRTLAHMVGVSRTVMADVARGDRTSISRSNAVRLDPWVYGTRPGPSTRHRVQTTGGRIDGPAQAQRLPRGALMVDRYGRGWQMGMHRRLGTGMDLHREVPKAPSYPCKLVYVPAVTSTNKKDMATG